MRRAVVITVCFAVCGPPVGLAVALVLLTLFAVIGSDAGFGAAFVGHLSDALEAGVARLYFWPLLAVVPAAALGAFFGWHQGWRGPVPFVGAVLAGSGVGALFFLVSEFFGWGAGVYGASFSLVVSGLSTLVLYPLLPLLARNDPEALEATAR